MKNINTIHETVIRDIIDLAQDIRSSDIDIIANPRNNNSFKSITSKSKDLIMVFPVIGSNNCTFEKLSAVVKACEKKCVILLDILFQAANICSVDSGEEFIKKFHTNIKLGKASIDDFNDFMTKFVDENGLVVPDSYEHHIMEAAMQELKEMNVYFEEADLSEGSMMDYRYMKDMYNESTLVPLTPINEDDAYVTMGAGSIAPVIRNNVRVNPDIHINMPGRGGGGDHTTSDMKNMYDVEKNLFTIASGRILDADVKKCNELVPSLLYVNFTKLGEEYATPSTFIVGVKAKLYVCDSQDIMTRLELKYADSHKLLGLIRVATKELSFFKDFLWAIDRAKIDALANSRRGSSNKMWKVLEARAIKSRLNRALRLDNDATAITTLVITQEEVEWLKRTKYINLEQPGLMSKIMSAYNLMGFVIIDESLDIAKFLYDDGEGQFEYITFDNLEREQRDNSKKIVNLMSKVAR